MSKLVLLGGPTGVGKTTALRGLQGRLSKSAVLDADDVWRVSRDLEIPGTRAIAIQNVTDTMRGYFKAQCQVGIVAWVFARPELYLPVIDALKHCVDSVVQIYLISDPSVLESRLIHRGESEKTEYAKSRLSLIQELPFSKIDTTNLHASEVVDRICEEISR